MFDYFKANEQEQYLFLQLPLMLIKDEQFKGLSDSAKILYSLLLNRTSLSAKNGWTDEQGHVYIIYTIEEIMTDLNCWEQKATKAMKELKKIGLVNSVRQGLGKPNIIYVMNFATTLKYKINEKKEPTNPVKSMNCENHNSGTVKITIQSCENHNSGVVKIENQELRKSQSIYNDFDFKKDFNNIDVEYKSSQVSQSASYPQQEENDMTRHDMTDDTTQQNYSAEMKKEPSSTKADQSRLNESPFENKQSNSKQYTTYAEWESRVKENIRYGDFIQERQPYIKLINEIVYNIVDILTETSDFITLNKKENKKIRTADAKELCLRLQYRHILYILEKFTNVTDPVTHKSNYLKAIILSSLKEMESYYQNEYRQGNL